MPKIQIGEKSLPSWGNGERGEVQTHNKQKIQEVMNAKKKKQSRGDGDNLVREFLMGQRLNS